MRRLKKKIVEEAEVKKAPAEPEKVVEADKGADVEVENLKKASMTVEEMIEENKNSIVTTDYQRYVRKLMKEAGKR